MLFAGKYTQFELQVVQQKIGCVVLFRITSAQMKTWKETEGKSRESSMLPMWCKALLPIETKNTCSISFWSILKSFIVLFFASRVVETDSSSRTPRVARPNDPSATHPSLSILIATWYMVLQVRTAAQEAVVSMSKLLDADDVAEYVLPLVLSFAHDNKDEQKRTAAVQVRALGMYNHMIVFFFRLIEELQKPCFPGVSPPKHLPGVRIYAPTYTLTLIGLGDDLPA